MRAALAKPRYMWPHFDLGQAQFCALFFGAIQGINIYELEHGQRVGNAVFRLIDANLYRPDWVAEQLPMMKDYWRQQAGIPQRGIIA